MTSRRHPRWPAWLIAAYAAMLATAVLVAMWLDLSADRKQRLAMELLRPAFTLLANQVDVLRHMDVPAIWILPGAALVLIGSALFARIPAARRRQQADQRRLVLLEVLCLGALSLVVVAYRFYGLNRIPREFVGELVFQVVCTSDWRSLLVANGGSAVDAPWAPLGLLHYLLTAAVWRFSGSTVLTLCFASAVASVLLLQVAYWFVRLLGGPLAAFIAASFYAASPVEMVWARNAMQPFNYPSIVVLLIAATTYLAITRHRLGYWLLVAFLMGLTRHSFGSAYAGFLIPIGAVGWLLLFDRERLRLSGWKPLWLAAGLAAWLAGPALAFSAGAGEWHWVSPVDPRLESRAFRGSGWGGSMEALAANVKKTVGPLYVGKRGDTIQTPTLLVDTQRLTFVSPLVMILFTAGLAYLLARRRRGPETAVLIPLVGAAILPGLMSTADPHRMASLYPTICAIAGLTAARGLRAFEARVPGLGREVKFFLPAIVLPLLLARSGALYFSQPEGEPPSVSVARSIKERVTPGTLLVLHVPYWLHVDLAYLLFDSSLVEPFGWTFIFEDKWDEELLDFDPRFDHLFHRHTILRERVPELETTRWRRYVFVLDDSLEPERKLEDLERKFGAVTVEHVDPVTWRGPFAHSLTIVEVSP